jgi:hypothetical protein
MAVLLYDHHDHNHPPTTYGYHIHLDSRFALKCLFHISPCPTRYLTLY